ncbi:MAG TPA: tyrosine-protein phosphatase [Acidimicrobiales bacterium]|jgi:protein tyrosine/serine phosphatase|nr:tyrosine-protein phosphatase [Acidimicrobiales bacterium]
MSLDRIVPFAGVLNFRDLGGYRTLDGRTTRWGRLFRSDALHDLTDEDLVVFRRLGVASVVDLRSTAEVARTGRGLLELESLRFVNSPVLSNAETEEPREESIFDESYLSRRYLQYLDVGAPAFVEAIREMTVPENYPLVFNCFLGKDRTGVLAALVLSCLGIERATIVEDYAVTDERVRFITEKLRRDPIHRETIDLTPRALLAAHEATMSSFLHEVDQRFGGARAWVEAAGITPEQVGRLEALILE